MYNGNVLIPTTNGEKQCKHTLINTTTGKVLWRWDDIFSEVSLLNDITYNHQFENLLTWQNGSRSYCINMDNGSTYWKIRRDRSFNIRITPLGQYFFKYGPESIDDECVTYIAFKGDIKTGEIIESITANFTYEHPDCVRAVSWVIPIPGQENLLLFTYGENLPDWISQRYFGVYDSYVEEWIWDKKLLTPPRYGNSVSTTPVIKNNKIYAAVGTSIVCHDLETGEQLWKRDFGGDFLFSGFIFEDGKVIANCEDTNMYALNAETGAQLWKTPTAGTGSRMSYLNGVVYMVGGSGGGRLFAIEAATGKILWRIDAGLLGEGRDARFRTNAVYVLPAKGNEPAKVIALSNLYAYCFEAVR